MLCKITARCSIYINIEGTEEQIDAALERVASGEDGALDNLISEALEIDGGPTWDSDSHVVTRFTIDKRAGLVRVPMRAEES